ncbi:hypothetical protein DM02DRAFT_531235 [Periconia macrospinosa]|uniref:YDG domain-containing protein n=1 Tax=Periconia macrospinosa TaxID=97972 RepID=A0A2V1DJH4_9PLEO|nr:hypothetical protein DM02DRAFT_531235 [Periconia macrospinosa]
MPRALNKPSPPVQPRSPLLSPRPIETSKPPTSRIETPRAKPSLKGKEKLATPVPLVDSGPSNILGQLDDSNLNQYTPKPLPSWYTRIESTSRGLKELNKRPTSDQSQYIKALSSMKGCIERCETGRGLNEDDLNELRNHVHKAEIGLKVDRFIVRKMRMLDEPYGLPRIFASTKMSVPMDLRMDAWQLYLRWYREEFEVDILRGIKTRQDRDRSADSIDPRWKKVPTKYYGEGDLVLGQWWPTQLCLVRDGAHGAAQGGIYGEKERGAYSIVLSGGSQYHDEDDGDTMWYSGTDGKDYMPTENTLRLVESLETVGNPIRVFRSHQLPKKNPYRPVVGLRYDGLYMIERKELINKEKQAFRFFLVRCPGQHPIRYGNNAAARPTIYEIKEDEKMRKFGR